MSDLLRLQDALIKAQRWHEAKTITATIKTIEALQAEIEGYRDALRAIRDENFIDLSNTGFPQAPMMRKYAREALKQEGE